MLVMLYSNFCFWSMEYFDKHFFYRMKFYDIHFFSTWAATIGVTVCISTRLNFGALISSTSVHGWRHCHFFVINTFQALIRKSFIVNCTKEWPQMYFFLIYMKTFWFRLKRVWKPVMKFQNKFSEIKCDFLLLKKTAYSNSAQTSASVTTVVLREV